MVTYRFYRDKKKWYIDYPEWKGERWELEMVAGADTMLNTIANSRYVKEVHLIISLKPFDDCTDLVKLHDTPEIGGAKYLLKEWNGKTINLEMWLCHVTEFVFGYLPEILYIK